MKSIIIQSGIPRRDIEDWLMTVAEKLQPDCWIGPGWTAELGPEGRILLGSLNLPRTKLTFSGDPYSCQKIADSYRLRFLSAGG